MGSTIAQHARCLRRVVPVALAALSVLAGCESPFGGADAGSDATLLDLAVFQDPNDPQRLIDDALNEYDPDDRARGLAGIAAQPFGSDPVFVTLYRGAIADDDAAVRAAAARALGLHGSTADAELLADALDDGDALVRWNAARSLQRIHNPAAVGALIRRLDEDREASPLVRRAAATALAQYAEPRVLEALAAALDDPDLAVNAAALESLRTLTGRELGDRPEDWVAFLRNEGDPFADRRVFEYPAYARSPRWFERLNPWDEVPREEPAQPVGMRPPPNR